MILISNNTTYYKKNLVQRNRFVHNFKENGTNYKNCHNFIFQA